MIKAMARRKAAAKTPAAPQIETVAVLTDDAKFDAHGKDGPGLYAPVSIAAGTIIPPPPREDEEPPDLMDLVEDRKIRLELIRTLQVERQHALIEADAKKARKPLTERIKTILGSCKISKARWESCTINYYMTFGKKRINPKKLRTALLTAGLNTETIETVIRACEEKGKDSYTLRIIEKGEIEEGEGED